MAPNSIIEEEVQRRIAFVSAVFELLRPDRNKTFTPADLKRQMSGLSKRTL